jgi:thiol-disulfide isomerase/thioredoxin
MNFKKNILICLLGLMTAQHCFAQFDLKTKRIADSFLNLYLNKTFPLTGKYNTINERSFEFGFEKKRTLYAFGFAYCLPCREQFPFLVEIADSLPYNNVVYITFDDKEQVINELKELKIDSSFIPGNLFIVSMKKTTFSKLVPTGFPAHYITDTNIIDDLIYKKQSTSEKVEEWLNKLKRNL